MSISRRGFLGLLTAALPGTALKAESTPALSGSMPKRKFGRHDILLSVVGMGGQTLGSSSDVKEARRIAQHAIDLGINFFENAYDYHGGRAEEWMGQALEGTRDRVFLMTKVCTHGKPLPEGGKEGAMRMLETSLKRLKTDHLDLWMIHQLENDAEVEKAYGPGGVIEALDLAKQQGKVRFTGFTGHTRPESHIKMLEGGYSFDASLMPVSAVGALGSKGFEEKVMPELAKRQVAVLGMKGFGGSKRAHLHGLVDAEKVVRYSLSYPDVCTHVIGIDKYEFVAEAVAAASKTPMTADERKAFAQRCFEMGGPEYANYLKPGYRDGDCIHTIA